MTIAEFFVKIGIKGADQTAKGLGSVKQGLQGILSTSLETKAALVGVFYGLSRLTTTSAAWGQSIKGFSDLTGLSADRLQRWQYMAKVSGGTADDMAASIKSVQNAMTQAVLGHGTPSGMEMLGREVGLDKNRLRDTFYVMDKLREFAQKTKNTPDIANDILKSFGLDEKTIQVMRTSRVELDKISQSKLLNPNEVGNLSKVNLAWQDLWHKIEVFSGKMVAKDGLALVKDLSKATDQVLKMGAAFEKLAQSLRLIEGAGVVFEGWGNIFSGISTAVDKLSEMAGSKSGANKAKDGSVKEGLIWALRNGTPLGLGVKAFESFGHRVAPPHVRGIGPGANKTINMNTTINNNGVEGAKDANTLNKKGLKDVADSYFQSPAQKQVK